MEKIYLSCVIPAFNESKILKNNLLRVIEYLKDKKFPWEVVVVDDGSMDETYKIAKSLGKKGVVAYRLIKNQGKGAALKKGFEKAKGNFIIFMDADLSVPLKNIDLFLDKLKFFEVVVASRRLKGSQIKIHQPFWREAMGRFYTVITRVVTNTNLADYTCGFKGFRKEAGKRIFSKSLISGWSYDAEIIFLSHKFGYKIGQVPVEWYNRKDTRVRIGKDVFTSFLDLIRIRVYDLMGKYA